MSNTSTTSTTTTSSSSISTTTTSSTTSSSTSSTSTTTTSSSTNTTSSTSSGTSQTTTTTSPSSTTTSSSTTSSTTSSQSLSRSTSTTTLVGGGGVTQTLTSTFVTTPTLNSTSTSQSSNSQPKGFFQNTGAVAGTFTAVGIVALALLIFIVTQTLRRRREKQFDREIAEAAAEAATAPVPVFLDDEDDHYGPDYGPGYGGGAGAYNTSPSGGYSDVSSHGTYGQPPMSHEGYPMSERSGPGPGPGTFFDHNAMYGVPAAAGAAGIGVARARSMRDGGGYAAALNEGNSPYPAFATSNMYNQQPTQQPMYRGPGSNEGHDIGMAASHHTGQSTGSDLSRMKSNGSRSLVDGYYPSTATSATANANESYASHYQPGFHDAAYQPSNPPQYLQPGSRNKAAEDPSDAYGGYSDYPPSGGRSPTPGLPNPFAAHRDDESDGESSEDHAGRRVLKVANN